MGWILDVVFIIVIVLGILLGVRRGFIAGICKLAGTIFSVAVAITFCNAFRLTLDGWFNLTAALADGIGNETFAGWIAVAIAFVILVIVVKLGAWLLGKFGTMIAERVKIFDMLNRLFGGLLGLLKAVLLLFLLLTVCRWLVDGLGQQGMHDFISSSGIVGAIFDWDWFIEATTFKFLGLG